MYIIDNISYEKRIQVRQVINDMMSFLSELKEEHFISISGKNINPIWNVPTYLWNTDATDMHGISISTCDDNAVRFTLHGILLRKVYYNIRDNWQDRSRDHIYHHIVEVLCQDESRLWEMHSKEVCLTGLKNILDKYK